jgi:putative transposase
VRGRKRHIVVDTLGFLLAVLAHPADIQDRPGAVSLLPRLQGVVSRLAILYADSGYAGPMVETACQALGGCELVTIAKDAAARGFHVLPKRWVVERTLAWLCRNRRLAKDYEHLPAVSEAFVKLAMICLMIARLT